MGQAIKILISDDLKSKERQRKVRKNISEGILESLFASKFIEFKSMYSGPESGFA
jgi:hypothetical protein